MLTFLPPGARIALFCPAGPPDLDRAQAGCSWLREQGYQPLLRRPLESARGLVPHLAGSDPERLEELEWALGVEAEAAWAVRGGYGLTRLIPHLRPSNYSPRAVLGFSDVTALLWTLQQAGWRDLWHAPNVQSIPTQSCAWTPASSMDGQSLLGGSAQGVLLGGNLCVLASMCGTPQALRSRGGILFLEDVTEAAYRIDRYLVQLRESGCLEGLRGVALGSFTDCPGDVPAVFREHFEPTGVPLLAGLPVGHGRENQLLPLGRPCRLEGQTLSFLSG